MKESSVDLGSEKPPDASSNQALDQRWASHTDVDSRKRKLALDFEERSRHKNNLRKIESEPPTHEFKGGMKSRNSGNEVSTQCDESLPKKVNSESNLHDESDPKGGSEPPEGSSAKNENGRMGNAKVDLEALDCVNIFSDDGNDSVAGGGQLCELHSYDIRTNSRGEIFLLQTGTKAELPQERGVGHEAALVLLRYFNPQQKSGDPPDLKLAIKSPHIKRAFRDIVKQYPGVNINSKNDILLVGKPFCLFHYREEFKKYAMEPVNERKGEHILFCLKYMEKALQSELESFNSMIENTFAPGLEHEHLWMVFRPGDLLFQLVKDAEVVVRLVEMKFCADAWQLDVVSIMSDGKVFGHVEDREWILKYDGFKSFTDLPIFPLKYHSSQNRIRKDLIERGKKYVSLFGIHHRLYEGLATSFSNGEEADGTKRVRLRHKIVIDCDRFNSEEAELSFSSAQVFRPELKQHLEMSDDQHLICSHEVPGYSLVTKRWYDFDVSKIKDLQPNSAAFERLVLPQETKDLICSLVNTKAGGDETFDDLIEGKGRGIVFLLHGPPGVGKTFTAESIAEHMGRPLITISCGDLGNCGETVETNLSNALALATKWNAVVLIDEADVFMAERTVNDLGRNDVVSVMLRKIEYFEGILFLTTNRVQVIDPAFLSRIHFRIAYPHLTKQARKEIWTIYATQGTTQRQKPSLVSETFLDIVSEYDMNGRDIKNTVRVAHGLAVKAGRALEAEDIHRTLRHQQSFDSIFKQQIGQDSRLRGICSSCRRVRYCGLGNDEDLQNEI